MTHDVTIATFGRPLLEYLVDSDHPSGYEKDVTMRRIYAALLMGLAVSIANLPERAFAGDERTIAHAEAQRHARFNLIKAVQAALKGANYDPGPIDGLDGPKTEAALRSFQSAKGLEADGTIGPKTLKALGLAE